MNITHSGFSVAFRNALKPFLFVVFMPVIGAAQSTGYSFSLQQAIDYAIQNQVSIKNAELDRQISKSKVDELIGVGLPQINGKADINHFIEIPTSFVPGEFFGGSAGTYFPVQFGQPYTSSVGVSASQLLFDGSYVVGLQASKTYTELAVKNLSQSKIETAAAVSKAYYLVLVAQERLKQLESDVVRLKKLSDDTKAMYENGFVEKIDNDRVELNYNLVENARTNTQRFLENSYNILKYRMGMDLKTNLELTEKITDFQFDPTLLKRDSVDYTARIEYSILQTQYRLSELDVKKNKFSRLPTFMLFGSYSANASRNEFNIFQSGYKWYPTAIVGASVSLPLFGGFQKYSQTTQAKLNQQKVENAFYLMEQGINLEYNNAITTLNNSIDKLKTQEKNRDLARDVTRVSKIKYDQGVGSNLEVVDAEASLREAETNYYTALLEAIIAKIDLDVALGNIKY
ncbi:MAG TPA: TolC family protein [Bacteroidia bacterium]|nr:TolC family protein [Bacteroidia bacterium]